ncbi:hypothetical protein BH23VER1_BH23VER1_17860 [soil metagenome]
MRLFLSQLRWELVRLLGRKRTYIGFGAFVVLEVALVGFFQLDGPQRWIRRTAEEAGAAGDVMSALTLAFLVLSFSVFLLGGIYVALVAGDIVAKDAEDGTLRMVLCRPVSRLRVLLLKWISCLLYTFVLIGFIGLTSLLAGVAIRGWGGTFLVAAPEQGLLTLYPWGEGLRRYGAGVGLLALSMTTVGSLAFFFSCLRIKPAAATILALTVLFVDFVLEKMPFLADYRHYFLAPKMNAWIGILRDRVPVSEMLRDYAFLGGVGVTCFVLGWMVFAARDFKG